MKQYDKNRRRYTALCLVLCMLGGIFSCAKKTTPEGGPYDMTPPKFLRSKPANGAVNVKRKTIKLRFDENVKLEKQSEKVVFSPPQRIPPKITAGTGKTITIHYDEALMDSTTYIIDFADAIVDLNEGNPLDGFSFAFSTGPVIDSMILSGKVIDAYTLQPIPGITVGIYKNFQKEDLTKKTMLRTTRTTETGSFTISHLAPGDYTIFGMDDIDRSYNYTGASEGLAFLPEKVSAKIPTKEEDESPSASEDSTLTSTSSPSLKEDSPQKTPLQEHARERKSDTKTSSSQYQVDSLTDKRNQPKKAQAPQKQDNAISTKKNNSAHSKKIAAPDSTSQVSDSTKLAPDSITKEEVDFVAEHFTSKAPKPDLLLLFSRATRKAQKLQRATRPDSLYIDLLFTEPLEDLPKLVLIAPKANAKATHKPELKKSHKELLYWITDSTLYKQDSLTYQITYTSTDSLLHKISITDTLKLAYKPSTTKKYIPKKSIFQKWREQRLARKAEREAKNKAQRDSRATDSLQRGGDPSNKSTASKNKTNSIDSLASPQRLLHLNLVEQSPLRRGHPKEPLLIEFSEIPTAIDTTRMHLYYIEVDSTALAAQAKEKENTSPSAASESKEIRQEQRAPRKEGSFLGGASNPYESGIDRYSTPQEQQNEEDVQGQRNTQESNDSRGKKERKSTAPSRSQQSIILPPGKQIEIPYSLLADSTFAQRYQLQFEGKFGCYYQFTIDTLAASGVYGATMPSTKLPIKLEEENKFGSIHLKIDSLLHNSTATFELLNEADSVLLHCVAKDTICIDNILPNSYFARVWFDLNGNGKWDEGHFPNLQPEPVYYYPKELVVQPKFTQRILWQLNALPLYEQRPEKMKRIESKEKKEEKRERRNLNEEYVARMKERYGDKWNPTNRDRKMLGMPSRREEKESKKVDQEKTKK